MQSGAKRRLPQIGEMASAREEGGRDDGLIPGVARRALVLSGERARRELDNGKYALTSRNLGRSSTMKGLRFTIVRETTRNRAGDLPGVFYKIFRKI